MRIHMVRMVIVLLIAFYFRDGNTALGASLESGPRVLLTEQTGAHKAVIDAAKTFSGQSVIYSFSVRNETGNPVLLAGQVTCGCTSVSIKQSALRNNEETRVTVTIDTASRGGAGGTVAEPFILIDKLHGNKVLYGGVLQSTLSPTLVASKSQLYWSIEPGNDPSPQKVTFSNRLNEAVELKADNPANGVDALVSVNPEKIIVPAHGVGTCSIGLTKRAADMQILSNIDVLFDAHVVSNDAGSSAKLADWMMNIPIRATPRVPIIAIPGAITVGMAEFKSGQVTREIQVFRISGTGARITDVSCGNPLIKIVKKADARYEVVISKPSDALLDEVIIKYQVNTKERQLSVPIVVYLPGSAKLREFPARGQ